MTPAGSDRSPCDEQEGAVWPGRGAGPTTAAFDGTESPGLCTSPPTHRGPALHQALSDTSQSRPHFQPQAAPALRHGSEIPAEPSQPARWASTRRRGALSRRPQAPPPQRPDCRLAWRIWTPTKALTTQAWERAGGLGPLTPSLGGGREAICLPRSRAAGRAPRDPGRLQQVGHTRPREGTSGRCCPARPRDSVLSLLPDAVLPPGPPGCVPMTTGKGRNVGSWGYRSPSGARPRGIYLPLAGRLREKAEDAGGTRQSQEPCLGLNRNLMPTSRMGSWARRRAF